ncbi:MAG TPA: oligopeptide ABC transporter ATP-binding protein [Chloroflexi bacterium]|nr:oligopeptide ABC transporter ATP-binding protein [Chloroflexota bacterium]
MSERLVEVHDLFKWFPVQKSFVETLLARKLDYVRAVDGIDFEVRRGEVFGLAGESGSGKTTTGRLILRLIEPTRGEIFFDGTNILTMNDDEMRGLRQRMQLIFQDPYASLNPRMKIGAAIGHGLEIHDIAKGQGERDLVIQMMERVGLTPAATLYEKYPHQLSGGQRQRVVIARALILHPDLIVADEPIAMADVSVRALILHLMMELKEEFDLTYLFITHDLATAKYICDRIAIMYLGKIVESGPLREVYSHPQHPYTEALLSAVPVPNPRARREHIIPKGEIPSPINPPSGCRFHPRCPYAMEICSKDEPRFAGTEDGHLVACHLRR